MDKGCCRGDRTTVSLSPIKRKMMRVYEFSIGRMIVMIVGGVWLWDRICLIMPIKGVSA